MAEQQETLQIVITAKDEATKVLAALGGKVKEVESGTTGMANSAEQGGFSIGRMAAAVGLGNLAFSAAQKAIGFVTDTIKGSINAAKAEEAAMAKVDAIVKTLKVSHDAATKSIDAAAKSALKMGFDDEDAAISKAKLLQVTNDASKANDAFQLSMDLARFKGIDLESSTQAVTMALNGNVRMLKQLGIEVPKNATDMQILGAVHDRVAGQAEAFANTAAGASERYKVTMENLQETIGKAVLPVITQFFSRVSDFLQSERLSAWIAAIRKGFNDYVVPIIRDQLIPAWNNLADALKPIMPYLLDILKFLGIVIGATIIGGIKLLAITFDYVAGSVRGVIESVKSVVEWFQKAFEKVTQFKDATGGAIGGAVNSAGDFFKGLFKAEGGPISAGEPYIVGEKGPEMIIPSSSGTVIPNNKLGKMSGPTINFNGITVRSDNDIQTIVSQVLSALGRRSDLASKGIY